MKPEDLTIINMKLEANLNQFSVGICNDVQLLTEVQIKGNYLSLQGCAGTNQCSTGVDAASMMCFGGWA